MNKEALQRCDYIRAGWRELNAIMHAMDADEGAMVRIDLEDLHSSIETLQRTFERLYQQSRVDSLFDDDEEEEEEE